MKTFKPPKSLLLMVLLLAAAGLAYLYFRPIPAPTNTARQLQSISAKPKALAWPGYGQSSVSAVGWGRLASNGEQVTAPTASVAKVITALAVLDKKPLAAGQQGPALTLDSTDVSYFNDHYLEGGSVVSVKNGEQISEYQALQAMLLPSGNNMADSLARWAFGSQEEYLKQAGILLKKWGLVNTTVADASGLSPLTVSNASELVKLGQLAMAQPVLAEIVGQSSATVPVAGKINNVNWLLGKDGVVGIKTGNTDQAGGNFLFAAKKNVGGQDVTIVGSVMGGPTRNQAISDSRALIRTTGAGFEYATVLKKGAVVGAYSTEWGDKVNAVVENDLQKVIWAGNDTTITVKLFDMPAGSKKGAKAGVVTVKNGGKNYSQNVVLASDIPNASWQWRLWRN